MFWCQSYFHKHAKTHCKKTLGFLTYAPSSRSYSTYLDHIHSMLEASFRKEVSSEHEKHDNESGSLS